MLRLFCGTDLYWSQGVWWWSLSQFRTSPRYCISPYSQSKWPHDVFLSRTPLPPDQLTRRGLTSCSFLSVCAALPHINSLLNTNPFSKVIRQSIRANALWPSCVLFLPPSPPLPPSSVASAGSLQSGHRLIKDSVCVPVSLCAPTPATLLKHLWVDVWHASQLPFQNSVLRKLLIYSTQILTTRVFVKGIGEIPFWYFYGALTRDVVCKAVCWITDDLMFNVSLSSKWIQMQRRIFTLTILWEDWVLNLCLTFLTTQKMILSLTVAAFFDSVAYVMVR